LVPEQERATDVDSNVHEGARDELRDQKTKAKKMAAPRSGQVQGGNAQEGRRLRNPEIAIPRCSNMPKSPGARKAAEIIFHGAFPGKIRNF
jgi:hypothetical protein